MFEELKEGQCGWDTVGNKQGVYEVIIEMQAGADYIGLLLRVRVRTLDLILRLEEHKRTFKKVLA